MSLLQPSHAPARILSLRCSCSFNAKVRWATFSHDGNYLAVTHDRQTQIWHTPSVTAKEFAPFRLIRTYTGHFDDTTHIDWSHDDTYFVSSSKVAQRPLCDSCLLFSEPISSLASRESSRNLCISCTA